jgi:hypothetical protein
MELLAIFYSPPSYSDVLLGLNVVLGTLLSDTFHLRPSLITVTDQIS